MEIQTAMMITMIINHAAMRPTYRSLSIYDYKSSPFEDDCSINHVFIDVLYSLCLYLVPIKRAIDTSNFLITFNHLFRHDPSQGTHVLRTPSILLQVLPEFYILIFQLRPPVRYKCHDYYRSDNTNA